MMSEVAPGAETTTVDLVGVDVSTAAGLLRLANSFCDAAALLTAVELDLFAVLAERPATVEEIRQRLGLHGRGLRDFLQLLVALGLIEVAEGRYRNGTGASAYLVSGAPGAINGFLVGAARTLYPAYGSLTRALQTGRQQSDGDFLSMLEDPVSTGHFVRMMDGLTKNLGDHLAEVFDFGSHRRVLDVGGCAGSLLAQLLAIVPELRGGVFDLPPLEPFFWQRMRETGYLDRVSFHGGNFFEDPLPAADVMIYGHILHDWDACERSYLLKAAYDALEPDGALLIYDRMLTAKKDNVENLIASLNMLLMTDGGGEYLVSEIIQQAEEAGFTAAVARPLLAYDTLVVCHKN